MSRSTIRSAGIVTFSLLLGGGFLGACGGGGAEATLVRGFFQASRYSDQTTLGNMSMVTFDPQEDGIASSPSVDNVSEEARRPLRMGEFAGVLAELESEADAFAQEKNAYQDEFFEDIARVIEAEREGEDVARGDEEVQVAWRELRDNERAFSRKLSDAQTALNEESLIADASTYDPSTRINVREYEGELVSKEVTVTANISKGDEDEERTMVFTFQKVELEGGEEGVIDGRWIITAIE